MQSNFNSKLNAFKPSTKDGREMKETLTAFYEDLKSEFVRMMEVMKNEFMELYKVKDAQIDQLNGDVHVLQNRILKLEERLEDQEAYERRDTLIFSGDKIPTSNQNENCANLVCKLLQENLNLILSPSAISISHRLGGKPVSQKPDRRKIIVKLCRREDKMNILRSAKTMKPEKLFINESLTQQRQEIATALRKAKRELPSIITGTTSIDGAVYVWTKSADRNATRDVRHRVNNFHRFEDFCKSHLGKPMSHFLLPVSS